MTHAGRTDTIDSGHTSLRVINQHGELLITVPRNGTGKINRTRTRTRTRRRDVAHESYVAVQS